MAKGNQAAIQNKDGLRAVPNSVDAIAIKIQASSKRKCRICHKVIETGKPAWFCDGIYLKGGEDGWWHGTCL